MDSGARAHVDDVVCLHDGLFVVLHHQHRVPQVPHPLQRIQQAGVVPLMQADGWFVQDVEHPHQAGTDLGGQPDTLSFSSRQGPRGAVQGEVIETNIHQEVEPFTDLLEDAAGDLRLFFREGESIEKGQGVHDGEGGYLADILAPNPDEQRLLFQAGAVAGGAGHDIHELFQLFPHLLRIGFPVPSLQVVQHPFEFLVIGMAPTCVLLPPELHLFPV
ncbi:MAG: hypothetical protein A4E69_01774 [Syntrophus sp. PtaB.Bin138]|nr:MAG: hypothetical protein A4E69_01774 [Syntrophus sp. PtaB.Bin138]